MRWGARLTVCIVCASNGSEMFLSWISSRSLCCLGRRLWGSRLYDALDVGILGCRGARSITTFNKEMETGLQPEYLRHDSQSLANIKLTTLSLTMATGTDGALSSLQFSSYLPLTMNMIRSCS